ncbi:hypothetical protein B484DRAFT_431992 [Ochromonadaceae sp. CCMP2298]|nr:hypothetical protein B484DRAFT_431992 [Ochromonadaceae sp. CCMP2298]|mmetsp:Transcript_19248/g.42903  ORF Transcript_19248/g.42903 Transcript_19248/m.42903 type:complete len:508 (-) Transcript_19248:91-1614(-)
MVFRLLLLLVVIATCCESFIRTPHFGISRDVRQFAVRETELAPAPLSPSPPSLSPEQSSDASSAESSSSDAASSRLLAASDELISALQASLEGRETDLDRLLEAGCGWQNSFVGSRKELEEGVDKFANFFSDAAITVFDRKILASNQVQLSYQISFWYPLPWRPRVIVPSTAVVTFGPDMRVASVEEKWEVSLLEVFLKQILPRWWDVWHVFSSPSPEYPPIRQIAKVGKVSILQLPESVFAESRWQGSAKYAGPPLLVAPGFSLFGYLKSTRPRREPYLTTLPVEVQSSKFRSKQGEDMKQSSWLYHVPTTVQAMVLERARGGQLERIEADSLLSGEFGELEEGQEAPENLLEEVDYQVGFENINLMKSVTGGTLRGNFTLDETRAADYEAKQQVGFRYRVLPRRVVAAVDLKGEVDGPVIANALGEIRAALAQQTVLAAGGRWKLSEGVTGAMGAGDGETEPLFGLQVWSTKACFNNQGEPSMAIYEMQYTSARTTLYVNMERCE